MAVLLSACSGGDPAPEADGGTDGAAPSCREACPVLDSCGAGEVPVPGGGCKAVGVRECQRGLRLPGASACTVAGIPEPCPQGWARVKDRSCYRSPAEPNCGSYCAPLLPSAPCSAGSMTRLGSASCQPIGDCSAAVTGTVHVDGAYGGGGSDGSPGKPYATIGQALKVAGSGDQIAVAPGIYKEDLTITTSDLAIRGRCAKLVTIQGSVALEASGASLRGVTVTGSVSEPCVDLAPLYKATLEEVALVGCGGPGLKVWAGATATLKGSLVAKNTSAGLAVTGGTLTVEGCVVRDTLPGLPDLKDGEGVEASLVSTITIKDSLITGNRYAGLELSQSKLTLERSVIRRTQPAVNNLGLGAGIIAGASTIKGKDVLVVDNRAYGVAAGGGAVDLERSTVRDTRPMASDQTRGQGFDLSVGATLRLTQCLVANNQQMGIDVDASKVTLDRTVIRDTQHEAHGQWGGFAVALGNLYTTSPSSLVATDCVMARNRQTSFLVWGSAAVLRRVVIRDSIDEHDSFAAHSIMVGFGPGKASLKLSDALLTGSTASSLAVFSAAATVERTVISGSRPGGSVNPFAPGIETEAVGPLPGINPEAKIPTTTLALTECAVEDAYATGVALGSETHATIKRSVVRRTRRTAGGSIFGDAIQVDATFQDYLDPSQVERSTLELSDSLLEDFQRAGVLFYGGNGSVTRSVIRGGIFPVALEQGGEPTIGADNLLEDNASNEVVSEQGLKPSKAPILPSPGL